MKPSQDWDYLSVLSLFLGFLALVFPVSAQVLFPGDFSPSQGVPASDPLNGMTPDITVDFTLWVADPVYSADGTKAGTDSRQGAGWRAYLALENRGNASATYTASATMTVDAGTSTIWETLEFRKRCAPTNLPTIDQPTLPTRFFAIVEREAPAAFSVTIQNNGVSGQNTTEAINNSLAPTLATNPEHLVLYYGANDALNSNKLVALKTFRTNLTSMVNQALTSGVETISLVGIHPANMAYLAERHPTHPELLRLQDHLAEYNTVVSEVATATGVTFIDWRATFLRESPGTTIDNAVANNAASLLRCELNSGARDGIHLTVAGNRFLGIRVAQALSSVVASGDTIACMGDSITFGVHVTGEGNATGETYPGVLSSTLNQ